MTTDDTSRYLSRYLSRCSLPYLDVDLLLVAVPSDGEAGEEAVLRHAQPEAARLQQGRAQARRQLVNLGSEKYLEYVENISNESAPTLATMVGTARLQTGRA